MTLSCAVVKIFSNKLVKALSVSKKVDLNQNISKKTTSEKVQSIDVKQSRVIKLLFVLGKWYTYENPDIRSLFKKKAETYDNSTFLH